MTQEQAAQLLQKYLEGKCTLQETELVEQWYGSLRDRSLLPQERKIIIAEEMRIHIKNAIAPKANKRLSLLHIPWLKIAAMLVVVCSIGLLMWSFNRQLGSSEISQLIVATQANERKVLTLADGSTIVLEPSSKITYPSSFSSKQRSVKLLDGEAFFEIAHEEKRPFSVQLPSKLIVRVLGTSFKVRDFANEKMVKVTVATGKVAVANADNVMGTLIKGEELAYHRNSRHSTISTVAQQKTVKISFEGTSLAEVIKKLEYIYSIRISVTDPALFKLSTSADFNSGQRPSKILDIICKLHGLRFSEDVNHRNFKIYR